MSDTFLKVEVISGVARRRRFSTEVKLALVAESMQRQSGQLCCPSHGAEPEPGIPLETADER